MEILKIKDVYGDTVYVRAADYERLEHMVRMTTSKGVYLCERVNPKTGRIIRLKPGTCTMFAKANVAAITAKIQEQGR